MTATNETEERILAAASRVFQRKGTAGARTREIAREAGVNSALVHYYFRSKEQLAEAVYRRALRQFSPTMLELLASELSLEEKVERLVRTMIGGLLEHPLVPGYIMGELSQGAARAREFVEVIHGRPVEGLAASVAGPLGKQIEERVRAGAMRPIAPETLVMNTTALCVYPFITRPALMVALSLDEEGFAELMRQRAAELPAFILAGLRP